MGDVHCPGQDMRFWKPEDIFDVTCPHCGESIEFWKDEAVRTCSRCRNPVCNPRMNLGCAKWCRHAAECLQKLRALPPPDAPTPG